MRTFCMSDWLRLQLTIVCVYKLYLLTYLLLIYFGNYHILVGQRELMGIIETCFCKLDALPVTIPVLKHHFTSLIPVDSG